MKFTSLNDAFEKGFIKSLPCLTRLDLTANEIKVIELVLSFTRSGKTFYMNFTDIAENLVLNNTPNKAKTVGNIVRSLKKKGYITTTQTHNYNGKIGGSSVTITVDENYLEQLLLAVFNTESPNVVENQNAVVEPVLTILQEPTNPNQEFLDELAEMDLQQTAIAFDKVIPIFQDSKPEQNEFNDRIPEFELLELDLSPMDEVGFTSHLKKVIRLEFMSSLKSSLQMLIDNPENWELDKLKFGLTHLIDEQKTRMTMKTQLTNWHIG